MELNTGLWGTPGESHGWATVFNAVHCLKISFTAFDVQPFLSLPLLGRERLAPDCDKSVQRRKWKQVQSCFRGGLHVWGCDYSINIHLVAMLLFLWRATGAWPLDFHGWMSINGYLFCQIYVLITHLAVLRVDACSIAILKTVSPWSTGHLLEKVNVMFKCRRSKFWY